MQPLGTRLHPNSRVAQENLRHKEGTRSTKMGCGEDVGLRWIELEVSDCQLRVTAKYTSFSV